MFLQRKKIRNTLFSTLVSVVLIFSLVSPTLAVIPQPKHTFPKTVNFFLAWSLTEVDAVELAKWDVVVLDMEIQERQPEMIKKIRKTNPDIVLLAYITSQEVRKDASTGYSIMRKKLVSGIADKWYLKNSQGDKLSWWPGTYLLNVTESAPQSGGQNFNDYLVDFVVKNIYNTKLWNGVFYDNAWDNVTHFAGDDIDFNLDGRVDTEIDAKWREGMKFIYEETRKRTSDKFFIIGNGTTREYREELNGKLLENFIPEAWAPTMNTYAYNDEAKREPKLNLINANTSNGKFSQTDYKRVRFALGSTLLQDGYFSYDFGDQNHGQTWWYDEYDSQLGDALSDSTSQTGKTSYAADVWQRDFENGLVVVNSTNQKQTVDLGGEYEKIRGTQDPKVNDGGIVSEISLDAFDGRLLLKTFSILNDVLFKNGAFVRFFRPDGARVRNGFFVFEDKYKGGDHIAHLDINGNSKRELFVATGNRIRIWRDDGKKYLDVYPYSTRYTGQLRVAIGDINGDKKLDIIVAPTTGHKQPILAYDRSGALLFTDWYPFGEKYSGGYSVAIADVDADKQGEIILGSGVGMEPWVYVYSHDRVEQASWLAYEKTFRGGVNVAAGDVDKNDYAEVITGPGQGGKPLVQVFTGTGKSLYKQFSAYSTFGFPGIDVRAADVDFDGQMDIVGMSDDF